MRKGDMFEMGEGLMLRNICAAANGLEWAVAEELGRYLAVNKSA